MLIFLRGCRKIVPELSVEVNGVTESKVYPELEKEIDLTFEWLIRYESGQ